MRLFLFPFRAPSLPARFLIIFSSSLIVSQYWPPQHTAPADQRKRAHKLQGKEKYEESMTRTYFASEWYWKWRGQEVSFDNDLFSSHQKKSYLGCPRVIFKTWNNTEIFYLKIFQPNSFKPNITMRAVSQSNIGNNFHETSSSDQFHDFSNPYIFSKTHCKYPRYCEN